ncbi:MULTISPECIES: cytochrome b [Ectothiorhodospira]|uniref:Cytochrome b561 n=1 Tax=Ectothiorhodospira marina TaxID=1396821 RepID=A0A1H7QWG9_9GAMM|nr:MULTISPECIES: cytochrome b/b6 domain-containing protein [Ectothiorhodospira]MCG5515331.1 cytochrome b/b6 domain-containing protein [Ectothiorhodospira sp. 9100]MCG5519388.1 cytochrome b/b6 domain-containing protein [Ectothiorhodospira sp. 9905]SEL52341.1 cytochrome b561 [Ectothiorhodospira marina]
MSTDYPSVGVASGLPRHSFPLRVLHWLIAVLLAFSLIGGFTLGTLGHERIVELVGTDIANIAYMAHKTLGITILGLMVLRLVVRLLQGTPPYAVELSGFQRFMSRLVHFLLYVMVIAIPIVGSLATAAAGFPVNFFTWELPAMIAENPALAEQLFQAHMILGLCIIAVLVLHIGAGLRHKRRGDWVMHRISLGR